MISSPSTKGAGAFQFWQHLYPQLEKDGARVILMRGHSESDGLPNVQWSLNAGNLNSFARIISDTIESENVTHVVTSISQSDILFGLTRKRIGKKVSADRRRVSWTIYVLGQPYPVKNQCSRLKRFVWKTIWIKAASRADRILTVSNYLNRLIAADVESVPIGTVYPGIGPSAGAIPLRASDIKEGSPLSIGFVGRLSPEKDPELFCRIADSLASNSFHLFGDGQLRISLESKYPGSLFHGFKDRGEIYSEIDLMLITSVSEGLPTILMEASEAGVIPIVADVGGCAEAIHPENRDLLVINKSSRHNLSEWSARIDRLGDESVREVVIRRQKDWITQNFMISNTSQGLLRSIRDGEK